MENFIIPVTEVKMTGEQFNEVMSEIKRVQKVVSDLEQEKLLLTEFIKKLTSLMNYRQEDFDMIMAGVDYDIMLSAGVSEKATMHIQKKK